MTDSPSPSIPPTLITPHESAHHLSVRATIAMHLMAATMQTPHRSVTEPAPLHRIKLMLYRWGWLKTRPILQFHAHWESSAENAVCAADALIEKLNGSPMKFTRFK